MKKLIAILLMLALAIPLTANLTFAEELSESEKEEILQVAKKSWHIYDAIGGKAYALGHIVFMSDNDQVSYDDMLDDISDFVPREVYYSIEDMDIYIRTNFRSLEEMDDYIDKFFVDNTFQSDKLNLKYQKHKILDDGYLYLLSSFPAIEFNPGWDFENADFSTVGDKVVVTLCGGRLDEDICPEYQRTIELVKTSEGYKVCGGSVFYGDVYGNVNHNVVSFYSPTPPATGENTVLYLAVACGAVAAMTAVALRRKREAVA